MASLAVRRSAIGWLYTVHLWIGVLVALQLLLWTASGLFMTSNAIATVRGDDLRRPPPAVDLAAALRGGVLPPEAVLASRIESAELRLLLGRPVYVLDAGERRWLVDARSGQQWHLTGSDALAIAREQVRLAEPLQATPVSDPPPLELRRPGGAWRIADADDTHVYVGSDGRVLAVRTGLWRWHDFAWGLHILDPAGRENSHHPLLIGSALLALVSVLSGVVLIGVRFGRRR